MIEVYVDDWCKDCGEFESKLVRNTTEFRDYISLYENVTRKTDTMIICKHRDRCRCIAKYIENQIKKKQQCNKKEDVKDE